MGLYYALRWPISPLFILMRRISTKDQGSMIAGRTCKDPPALMLYYFLIKVVDVKAQN